MSFLTKAPSPTPDTASQRLWLLLVIVGAVLAIVGWLEVFR